MFQTKSAPFEDEVEKATSENNLSEDWSLIMHICDIAINYQDGSKFCLKAITKRLHHNVPRVVMQALVLLDACVKNCDKRFLLQVASSDFTTEVQKLLKKMHPLAATKLKELLQKWSIEEFKADPELCIIPSLYYKLKSEGVEFPSLEKEKNPPAPVCTDPNAVTSQEEENDIIKALEISLKDTGRYSITPDVRDSEYSSISDAKPVTESFKARAIFDFEAVEDNEITIKKGEIVLVLDNSNSNWWKGSNHRGEGLFPANFVSENLDLNPPVDEIETLTVEEEVIDNSDEPVTINEEKIDEVINWLNDVDPTEDLSDPEDMLKLEKECSKMVPLIEKHLQAIDLRMAKLDETNIKIMEAFELFHELSDKGPVLSSNMKLYSTMQTSFPQHTLPYSVSNVQSTLSTTPTTSTISAEIPSQEGSQNPADSLQQINNSQLNASQTSTANVPAVTQTSNIAMSVTNPLVNHVVHPGAMLNPYSGNVMGGIFVPPGAPYPFMPNTQQGYPPMQFPVTSTPFVRMPVHPAATQMYSPYYYFNNAPIPVGQQSNASTLPSNNQQLTTTQNVTLNTSTAVSSVQSETPLSSVANYSSDLHQMTSVDSTTLTNLTPKQDSPQNISIQASGDGHTSTSTSSSENS